MRIRLLCWIGLHSWRHVTDSESPVFADSMRGLLYALFARKCRRCGKDSQ